MRRPYKIVFNTSPSSILHVRTCHNTDLVEDAATEVLCYDGEAVLCSLELMMKLLVNIAALLPSTNDVLHFSTTKKKERDQPYNESCLTVIKRHQIDVTCYGEEGMCYVPVFRQAGWTLRFAFSVALKTTATKIGAITNVTSSQEPIAA